MAGGVLGRHSYVEGPWAVEGDGARGYGMGSGSSGGSIDEKSQKEFALQWIPWKDYIRVE